MTELSRLRVLLVEDNELDARTMRRALARAEETEFDVHHVADLATALARLEAEGFDCILLDLSLPDSEGLVSVDTLTERAPHSPIVVLTGLDDPETSVEAVRRGAQDYLTKGRIDPELVGRSLRYAVARHHSETELRTTTELLNVLRDRERIARDLHDTVVQQLFATGMGLQVAAGQAAERDLEETISGAVDSIDDAIRQLREAIFDLHDHADDEALAEQVQQVVDSEAEALGFRPSVRIGPIEGVVPAIRSEVVAIVREGLSNVARHAHASAAEVIIDAHDGHVVVQVIDNGRGVDVRALDSSIQGLTGHGMKNMARRAEDLAGSFRIGPGPGGGTELEWRVPFV